MQKCKKLYRGLDMRILTCYNNIIHPGIAKLVSRLVGTRRPCVRAALLGPSNDNPNYIIQVGNVFGFIISIENVL